MSQRRSRRSSGLDAGPGEDQLAEFNDFRRRHARQNRDIINENITRKGLIRSLQDQVSSLQAEVLELRHENAALSRQLSVLKQRGGDEATTQAIDMILLAVPALQRFRGLLADQGKPKPRERITVSAVGPRQGAAVQPGLDTLGEEDEGEEREETPRRKGKRHSRSAPSTPSEGSPFVSPSPKRTPRRRRRRESGLFPPQPQLGRSPTPEADESATASAAEPTKVDGWHEQPDEDTVEAVVTPTAAARRRTSPPKAKPLAKDTPDSAQSGSTTPKTTPKRRKSSPGSASAASPTSSPLTPLSDSEPARRALAPARAVPVPTPLISGPSDTSGPTTTPASTPVPPATTAPPALTPTPTPSALSLSATSTTSADEDGPRSRRARSSVSYKEPSLRTKMRKPDGVSLDAAVVGVRRKSALPRSTAKPDLGRAVADIERESEREREREREVEEWAREHGLPMVADRDSTGEQGKSERGRGSEEGKQSPRTSSASPGPTPTPASVVAQARPRTPSSAASAPKERASSKKGATTAKRRTLGAPSA